MENSGGTDLYSHSSVLLRKRSLWVLLEDATGAQCHLCFESVAVRNTI